MAGACDLIRVGYSCFRIAGKNEVLMAAKNAFLNCTLRIWTKTDELGGL